MRGVLVRMFVYGENRTTCIENSCRLASTSKSANMPAKAAVFAAALGGSPFVPRLCILTQICKVT
jgi:hypothetical protein